MKTKDSISKKRQKLSHEIEQWVAQEKKILTELPPSPEREKALIFFRQEIAKREDALKKLRGCSWAQELAGWR